MVHWLVIGQPWDVPGGLVVKTALPMPPCRGHGFDPWWGGKIAHATQEIKKGFRLPMLGTQFGSLVQEDHRPRGSHTRTPQLLSLCPRARSPRACAPNQGRHRRETPGSCYRGGPCTATKTEPINARGPLKGARLVPQR